MAEDRSSGRPRLSSLDALRGIAVLLMIEQHVGVWLWRGPVRGETLGDHALLVGFNAMGGFGAPLFFLLAGIGSALFAMAKGRVTDAVLVRRGLVLLGFGLVMNLVTPSWFSWGSFFALHLIGVGMILAPLWRRLSDRGLIVATVVVILATPLVQLWLETPVRLDNPRMRDVSLPGGPLRLAIAESQYPILPWLAIYVAGSFAGRVIGRGAVRPVFGLAAVFGVVGGVGALAGLALSRDAPELVRRTLHVGLGWFPCSSAMVSLMLGAAALVVALALVLERARPLGPSHPLVTLGRASLTIFMLHLPLFREWTRPIGVWQALPAGVAMAVIAAFSAVAIALCWLWRHSNYRFGAEWVLRKLAG